MKLIQRKTRAITSHRSGQRQQGSAYILVLGVAMIVTVIGVSAVTASRIQLRRAGITSDMLAADIGAQSAVDLAVYKITHDVNWRSTYTHDTWTVPAPMGMGQYSFKIVDEIDAILTNDATQPVRVYGKAAVGKAVRLYSLYVDFEGLRSGGGSTGGTVQVRVQQNTGDAEQDTLWGDMVVGNTTLDLASGVTSLTDIVGLQFRNIKLPQGVSITNAYIQFKCSAVSAGAAALTIQGQDIDTAPQFSYTTDDISLRTRTVASVAWSPLAWNTVGEIGLAQRTPDISSVIQPILGRAGWASGNDLVVIISGSGTRSAASVEGDRPNAALLHLDWTTPQAIVPAQRDWRREVLP